MRLDPTPRRPAPAPEALKGGRTQPRMRPRAKPAEPGLPSRPLGPRASIRGREAPGPAPASCSAPRVGPTEPSPPARPGRGQRPQRAEAAGPGGRRLGDRSGVRPRKPSLQTARRPVLPLSALRI